MAFTVKDALALDNLKSAKVVAGLNGEDRVIQYVDIMETPDAYKWIRKNELIITTGYTIREDLDAQLRLARQAWADDAAGLAIKFGRYIGKVPSEMIELCNRLDFPLIALPDEIPYIDITHPIMTGIINLQAEELAYSDDVYKKLTKVALETNSIERIAEELSGILGKEVHIYPHNLSKEALSSMDKFKVFPIMIKSSNYGYIAVKSLIPLTEKEMIAIEHAKVLAALQRINYELATESHWNERRDLLDDLISGKPVNWDLVSARAAEFGFSLEGEKCVCIIDIDRYSAYLLRNKLTERESMMFRRSFYHIVQDTVRVYGHIGLNFLTAQQNDKIILLCPSGDDISMDWDKILRIIREKLGKLGNGVTATCAISNDVKNIMEIPHAYKTAQHIITLSRKIYGEGHTIRQKDAELYLILEKIDSISLSNSLLAPVLRSKKKDEYLLTLRTYLACDSNVSEAAEKLFIHRNTMQYRLKQIEKLIGQPMDSAETKTLLWLLLKAHELL